MCSCIRCWWLPINGGTKAKRIIPGLHAVVCDDLTGNRWLLFYQITRSTPISIFSSFTHEPSINWMFELLSICKNQRLRPKSQIGIERLSWVFPEEYPGYSVFVHPLASMKVTNASQKHLHVAVLVLTKIRLGTHLLAHTNPNWCRKICTSQGPWTRLWRMAARQTALSVWACVHCGLPTGEDGSKQERKARLKVVKDGHGLIQIEHMHTMQRNRQTGCWDITELSWLTTATVPGYFNGCISRRDAGATHRPHPDQTISISLDRYLANWRCF